MRKSVSALKFDSVVTKFGDNTLLNPYFEIAQTMIDSGVDATEIKKTLKALYGLDDDEISVLDKKLLKKTNKNSAQDISNENKTFIPENEVIPESGYMSNNKIVDLLRKYKNNSKAIQFIADMLEE